MRCALSFDENKSFINQELCAWGEMQSTKEEPAYKESDIHKERDKGFYLGCKAMADEVNVIIDGIDDQLTEEQKGCFEYIRDCIMGELAMQLFVILDNQEDSKCE